MVRQRHGFLRSDLFDGLSDAEEVRGHALPLVEQLNGAQRIAQDVRPGSG